MPNETEFKELIKECQKTNKKTEFLFLFLSVVSLFFGFILILSNNLGLLERIIGYIVVILFGFGFLGLAVFGFLTSKNKPEEELIYSIASKKPEVIKLVEIEPLEFREYANSSPYSTSYKICFYDQVQIIKEGTNKTKPVQILIFNTQAKCQKFLDICYKIFKQAKYEQLNASVMISGGTMS
jgi:hypothetical protein